MNPKKNKPESLGKAPVGRPSEISKLFPDLNQRRRYRYKTDLAYRRKVMKLNASTYRSKAKGQTRDASKAALHPHLYSRKRRIVINGKSVLTPCFSAGELASFLGYSQVRMYMWFREKRFPRPIVKADQSFPPLNVYTHAQAMALAAVFENHQKTKHQYYYPEDTDTKKAIFLAFETARRKEGINPTKVTAPTKATNESKQNRSTKKDKGPSDNNPHRGKARRG